MKTNILIVLTYILALLLTSVLVHAQPVVKPEFIKVALWNNDLNAWQDNHRYILKYDNNGNEISRVKFDFKLNTVTTKDSTQYRSDGSELNFWQFEYSTATGVYINRMKRENCFTLDGKDCGSKTYLWNNGNWVLDNGYEKTYVTVGNTETIAQKNYDAFFGNTWKDQLKVQIVRNGSGQKTQVTTSLPGTGGNLQPAQRETYGGWIDEAKNRFTTLLEEDYISGNWIQSKSRMQEVKSNSYVTTVIGLTAPFDKFLIVETLDGKEIYNGKMLPEGVINQYQQITKDTSFKETWWFFDGSTLTGLHEELTIYDQNKNIKSFTSKVWAPGSGWEMDAQDIYINTYNVFNQLTKVVKKSLDVTTGQLVNNMEVVYNNYKQVGQVNGNTVCSITGVGVLGQPDDINSPLFGPVGVLYTQGKVLVANGSNANIKVYTLNGTNLVNVSTYGGYGNNAGQLNNPQFLATGPNGLIYLTQAGNGRITVLSFNGNNLEFVGHTSTTFLSYPTGIAFNGNLMYVSETDQNRITIFSVSGTTFTTVGGFNNGGTGMDQVYQPMGLTVKDSLLYVADKNNSKIMVLKFHGNELRFFRAFGGNGMGDADFQFPTHVTTNGNEVYTVDTDNNRLKVYQFNGSTYRLIEMYGSYGKQLGRFIKPTSLAIVNDSLLLVTEYTNNRMQIFKIPAKINLSIGGRLNYMAKETISINVSTPGFAGVGYWVKQFTNNTIPGLNLSIPNASADETGVYTGYVSNGCRTYSTPSVNITVNKLTQTISGFLLWHDTFPLNQQYIAFPDLRISHNEGKLYYTSDPEVLEFKNDTIFLVGPGTASVTVGSLGNKYFLPFSQSITLTVITTTSKLNQTITMAGINTITLTGAPVVVRLKGGASSALPVTYSLMASPIHAATLDGEFLTVTGAGTFTITGTQPGNPMYNPASPFRITFSSVNIDIPNANLEETENDLLIYPNPAEAGGWISIKDLKEDIQLFDIYGNEVNFQRNENRIKIGSCGIYFLKSKNHSKKVVVK